LLFALIHSSPILLELVEGSNREVLPVFWRFCPIAKTVGGRQRSNGQAMREEQHDSGENRAGGGQWRAEARLQTGLANNGPQSVRGDMCHLTGQVGKASLPRRGAKGAARQSRNRETKADRKIEDRNIIRHPIFLSSILLSLCLSAAPLQQVSSQPAKDLDYCSAERGVNCARCFQPAEPGGWDRDAGAVQARPALEPSIA